MPPKPSVKIYLLADKEVHLVGEVVGVVWNIVHAKKKIMGSDGLEYAAVSSNRSGAPYIDFFDLRRDEERGEYYENDDNPVDGGMAPAYATQVAAELLAAVKYHKEVMDATKTE